MIGVSTSCFFPMLTEEALEHVGKLQVPVTEVFLNSPSERSPQFAQKLKAIADHYNVKIGSVHPFTSESEGVNFFGIYSRRFADEAEDYKRYFEFCNIVGADILVFHGARNFLPIDTGFYCDRYNQLREIAQTFGVRLAQENVARCHGGNPDFIKAMVEKLDTVHFVLDIKQAIRGQICPFTMLETMGENLIHIHLSDNAEGKTCLIPGAGTFDLSHLAQKLNEGYKGNIILELYSWDYENDMQLKNGVLAFEELMRK